MGRQLLAMNVMWKYREQVMDTVLLSLCFKLQDYDSFYYEAEPQTVSENDIIICAASSWLQISPESLLTSFLLDSRDLFL